MENSFGYGKVILFGEHFVVHGCPAIAAGISNKAVVHAEESEKNEIITKLPVVPSMSTLAIAKIIEAMKINKRYKVFLEGDLPTFGGLGSSAAFCVALVRYLAKIHHMNLTNEQVNRFAYAGEKAFHGNPSGIDNTMATYGGLLMFTRGETPKENQMSHLQLHHPLNLVVGITGHFGATTKMISNVQKFKEDDEKKFGQLLDEVKELVYQARHALEKGKLLEIGKLMNENQKLLEEVGVSIELNEKLNQIALDNGALGAKLTGGGGGGCCIALARDLKHAKDISKAIKQSGYDSFITEVR